MCLTKTWSTQILMEDLHNRNTISTPKEINTSFFNIIKFVGMTLVNKIT